MKRKEIVRRNPSTIHATVLDVLIINEVGRFSAEYRMSAIENESAPEVSGARRRARCLHKFLAES
jgi:hypothetical protein